MANQSGSTPESNDREDGKEKAMSQDVIGSKSNISRRQTLKLAGVGGITSGLGLVPAVAGKEGDEVEIVTLMEGDCVAETQKVPKQWYSHTKTAREAKNTLMGMLETFDGVHTVSMGQRENKIGDLQKHNVTVEISPDRDTDDIPDEINGIPINIRRGPEPEPVCTSNYNSEPDPIVGGLRWDTPDGSCGTLCCRVQWYNNDSWNEYFLSSRHIYTQICSHDDPNGKDWNQYDSTTVGTCKKEWQKYDSVLLNLDQTSRSLGPSIVNEEYKVVGRVTQDGLDCFKSNDTTVKKRGIATGYTTGEITDTNASSVTCSLNNNIHGIVKTNNTNEDGDSGGPVYYEDPSNNIYMVCMDIQADQYDNTYGVSAEHLKSNENIWFGGNSESGSC